MGGGCRCGGRCLFVTGSLILTAASILVGISFFGPFWLSNLQYANDATELYISRLSMGLSERPNRGLWAQCGKECTWFWQNKNELQEQKFSKLRWHLATQIMYFIAATLMLVSEIFARVQMCCHGEDSTCIFATIGTILLLSVGLQTASLATFGGGADSYYHAESNPVKITKMINNNSGGTVYLGWCYWVAVTGLILSFLAAIFFILAGCCSRGMCCVCEDCCEDSCDNCCCKVRCCCCE